MKLLNRKGSTLAMTLLIFVVLMIFGTFILSFMVTENKQAIYHENKTKSYYIARSGAVAVEAAILNMNEAEVDKLNEELDKGEVSVGQIDIAGNKANVVLKKIDNELNIESVSTVGGISNKVNKVMEVTSSISSETVDIKTAIFSHDNLSISNGTINGEIGTNNNVTISGNPVLNGDALLGSSKTFTAPDWWKNSWSGKIVPNSEINYPLPVFAGTPTLMQIAFPNYPSYNPTGVSNSGNLEVKSGEVININSNKWYNKININWGGKLIVDATIKDIDIWVDELNLFQIEIKGGNKVNIYIKSKLNINSNKPPIASINSPPNINVFYSGNFDNLSTSNSGRIDANIYLNPPSSGTIPSLTISNTRINGNLYVYKGNLSMSGNSSIGIDGDIFSNNGNVTIPNGNINGNIYAQNGKVEISGSASMKGDIYANNGDVKVTGAGFSEGSIYVNKGNTEISGYGRILKGNLHVNIGNITFGGSGAINGSIISSGIGNQITMGSNGTPLTVKGVIYAPQSDIYFTNNSPLEGGIVGKSVTITGYVNIKFKKDNINFDAIKVGSTLSSTKIEPGYFK